MIKNSQIRKRYFLDSITQGVFKSHNSSEDAVSPFLRDNE